MKHDLIKDIKITTELNELCEYIYTLIRPNRGGSTLGQGAGTCPPDSLVAPPQIQKLADRSDVTFDKMQIFRTLLEELTALPQTTC